MLEQTSAGVWDYVAAVPDPEGRGRGATSLLYWVEVTYRTLAEINVRKALDLVRKLHEIPGPRFWNLVFARGLSLWSRSCIRS